MRRFRSTPPGGRRPPRASRFRSRPSFDPRLRAGGDHADAGRAHHRHVSIHASVREATRLERGCSQRIAFRSTPPCGRRLDPALDDGAGDEVSIHASVREATRGEGVTREGRTVSIHASVREATRDDRGGCGIREVSIHASVREATLGK